MSNFELFLNGQMSFRELLQLTNTCKHEETALMDEVSQTWQCPFCYKINPKLWKTTGQKLQAN